MEGTPFGRYRLIELLGRGGMGEVWRAYDTETKRIVAIKVLPAHLVDDNEFVHRFRREAEAAAQLNSPHVVPIHNYGEIDGRLYVDMRLIEGRDLQTVLADGPLEPAKAVRVIEGVAMALHAAHQVGLMHRDVKPSNILLDANDFAYLIDFGIARAMNDTRMTKTGSTIGTFAYIAPERLDGEGVEDARVDIYSLACVLYECLTGEPPFIANTVPRLMMAHVNSPPPRPSTTRPEVPAQMDEVIATGMAKVPDQRYATTVELADAAREAITRPIPQPPTPTPKQPATEAATSHSPLPATEHARNGEADQSRTIKAASLAAADSVAQPQPAQAAPIRGGGISRRTKIALAAGAIVALAAVAAVVVPSTLRRQSLGTSAPTSQSSTPVTEAALDGLLLKPGQFDLIMGTGGMTAPSATITRMGDGSGRVSDKACLPLAGPVQSTVYAGSGYTAIRGQGLDDSEFHHEVTQSVVLFPSAREASAFFASSAQSWPACSNRQFGVPGKVLSVGPISDAKGMLSAIFTYDASNGVHTCQRALTLADNVAIDIAACSINQPDLNAAVVTAQQIATKVPTS
jgi:serine/threonine protein kinase